MLVPKAFSFSPPNGVKYEEGDEKRLCSQTPIPLWDIPPYLLGSQDPHFLPPKFHLGWAVGEDKLLELAQREFPDYVMYSDWDKKGKVLWQSIFAMVDGIIHELDVPEELHDCVTISEVFRPDGSVHLALCVGDNRIGILRPQPGAIEQLAKRLFNDEPPQWYLDPRRWQWKQRAPCALSPSKAKHWEATMNKQRAVLKDVHISA